MTITRGIEGSALAIDEVYPERQRIGPLKRRISRKARRVARHREVAALGAEWRTRTYHLQNQGWGAGNTGADGLTPRQRRRVKHKANAGRGLPSIQTRVDTHPNTCYSTYMTTSTAPRTRTVHEHWCMAAPRKNRQQVAPDAACAAGHVSISCATVTLTARQVRTFKSHPGQVRVTLGQRQHELGAGVIRSGCAA